MARIMSNTELTRKANELDNRVAKLEKESKNMAKVNVTIETGKGMSPADLFVSIKNGEITLDDFCVIAGLELDKVKESLNKIEKDGYVHNQKLDGRFVCSQMMRAMSYNPKGYNNVDGYTDYVNNLSYHEQFRFLKDELDRVAHMERQGDIEFNVRKHFFTKEVVVALCEDYLAKLREHVDALVHTRSKYRCKGKQYIKLQRNLYPQKYYVPHEGDRVSFELCGKGYLGVITEMMYGDALVQIPMSVVRMSLSRLKPVKIPKSNMVFVKDIEDMVFEPLNSTLNIIKANKCNFTQLHYYLSRFMDFMPIHFHVKERRYYGYNNCHTVPYDKCKEWVDAYKKRGAYMTASNLIKFHGCKLKGYNTKETLKLLESKAKTDYGWKLLGFLREVMRDSNYTPATFSGEMHYKYHC